MIHINIHLQNLPTLLLVFSHSWVWSIYQTQGGQNRNFYQELNFLKTLIDFLGCNTLQIYNLDGVGMLCSPEVKTILFFGQPGLYNLTMQVKKVTRHSVILRRMALSYMVTNLRLEALLQRCHLWQLFNNPLFEGTLREFLKSLICRICQSPRCQYPHHCWFQATKAKSNNLQSF